MKQTETVCDVEECENKTYGNLGTIYITIGTLAPKATTFDVCQECLEKGVAVKLENGVYKITKLKE